jgi:hypothetical protein
MQIYVNICTSFFKNIPNIYTTYAIALDTVYQCKGYSLNIKSVTYFITAEKVKDG